MLTIRYTEHFRIESPSIVTIGTFDGVHLGHQKLLKRLAEVKLQTGLTTVVLTFDPHPRKVLFPEQRDLKLLTTVEEKLSLLAKHGVDVTVVFPFTPAFAALDTGEYIKEILVKSLNVRRLEIGYDHRFGRERSGNIDTLREYAGVYRYEVEEISRQDIDHIAVSSSKIRKALEDGNVEQAAEFLGHRYFIGGTVVEGKKLGRTLGYPTANVRVGDSEKLVPGTGIYFVSAEVHGATFPGMMSIGYNPTTDDDDRIKCEVHLLNENRDLYGAGIRITFLKRIREEKKFANLNELRAALDEDKRRCEELMGMQA